jgi:hypothetical protein
MGRPPARHPRPGRHHAAWPLRRRGVDAVVRAGAPRPGQAAGAARSAHVPEDPLPAAHPAGRHPRAGTAAVEIGAAQPQVDAAVRPSRGRGEGDPGPAPGPGRPAGGRRPGPGHRPRRQGGVPCPRLAVRVAVAFGVPASFPPATRRAAPGGHAHAGHLGRPRAARQRVGRPGSGRADPAGAPGGPARRAWAMAWAPRPDRPR